MGGDFFDYVALSTGEFGFIVGDVAGKGAPAALLSALVLGMFVSEVAHTYEPSQVIRALNTGLFRRAIEARFLTAFYGVLDRRGRLRYTNGGHSPPLLMSGSEVSTLEIGGNVLGLFEDQTYDVGEVSMKPGDLVVAFSDGVVEAMSPTAEEFGEARIRRAMTGLQHPAPQTVVDTILTIVVVRYEG